MKFNLKSFLSVAALGLALIITGCDNNDNGDTGSSIPQVYQDLPGTLITNDTTWSGTLTLSGQYYVLPGVTLTIEKGTTVKWEYHNDDPTAVGALITLRADAENFDTPRASGKLEAVGTANEPIVFTSNRSNPQPGDWGGIILIGEGVNNQQGGEGEVEGLAQAIAYGGDNNEDNSGTLQYVRIEYVGYGLTTDSEINGLSLYSVGSNTTLDHIQVYKCTDDGYEFFGGAVNAKYMLSIFNDDDSFDMDEGWVGKGQFWLAVQASGADNGFESDGRKILGSGTASNPTLSNVTLYGLNGENSIGQNGNKDSGDKNYGMRLREDFAGDMYNFIIANFASLNFKLESDADGSTDATFGNFNPDNPTGGELILQNIHLYNNNGFADQAMNSDGSTRYDGVTSNGDPMFTSPTSGDFTLQAGSPGLSGASIPNDNFFEQVDFLGAMGTDNWASGNWVRWDDN
jgi:hypothetical protein